MGDTFHVASLQELADQTSWCLVTVHRGQGCEVLHGNPETVLGISSKDFGDGLAGRVVGAQPKPCAWQEVCESSAYLLRNSAGEAQWVESRSQSDEEGALVVSTRVTGPANDLEQLAVLARLSLGGSLMGPLAHEANNLVQGLSAAVYLFRDCLENGEAIEMEDVDQLGEAVKELQAIGAEVQGYARLTVRESEPVNLQFILEQAVRLFSSVGKLKTIPIELAIADDLPVLDWPMLQVDCVVLALLANAAEACHENPERASSVRVVAKAQSSGIALEFHDSGKGFLLEQGSTPFSSDKARHRNIGLGLSAVLAIIGSHGGSISAESNSAGSCIRVFLPSQP